MVQIVDGGIIVDGCLAHNSISASAAKKEKQQGNGANYKNQRIKTPGIVSDDEPTFHFQLP
ncbi:hypothetical protein MASR2M12_18420 [Bacteroidales bacterium]